MPLSILPTVGALATAGAAMKAIPTAVQFVRDVSTVSPTQAAAQNTIVSRAYVEEPLTHMDIISKLLKATQVMYAGMITILLDRTNEVVAGRTVSDQLNKVYTRGMGIEAYNDVPGGLEDLTAGIEALRPTPATEDTAMGYFTGQPGNVTDPKENYGANATEFDIKPAELLPVGQMLKVTLAGKSANGDVVKQQVTLSVRVTPYITSTKSMELILGHGAIPPKQIRKLQLAAGEISFWHDFVFQMDRLKRMEDAAKSDRTGAYAAFLGDTSNRDRDRLLDVLYNIANPRAMSANLANSIIICTEETMLRGGVAAGINLDDDAARQKFFKESYAMMLIVVDAHYHRVTMYMNGFTGGQRYSFDDFSPKKKMDASDFLQMFSSAGAAAGRNGRF